MWVEFPDYDIMSFFPVESEFSKMWTELGHTLQEFLFSK